MRAGSIYFYAVLGTILLSSAMELQGSEPSTHCATLKEIGSQDFHSQASQDRFVYDILYGLLGKQDQGYYLEIGAADPIYTNNSYFFENKLQWKGVSLDISTRSIAEWKAIRTNPLLIQDATQSDYGSILNAFPRVMDYLSLDIDENYDTALRKVLSYGYVFKVITIEHDAYRFGNSYREKERELLSSLGYQLLCPDVQHVGRTFEDWWIHPSAFPVSVLSSLAALDLTAKDHEQAVQTIQTLLPNNFQK